MFLRGQNLQKLLELVGGILRVRSHPAWSLAGRQGKASCRPSQPKEVARALWGWNPNRRRLSNSCVSCHCSLPLRLAPPDGDFVALDEKLVEGSLRCLLGRLSLCELDKGTALFWY